MTCYIDDPAISGKEDEDYKRLLLVVHNKIKNLVGDEFVNKTCCACMGKNKHKQTCFNDCKLYHGRDLSIIGFPSNLILTKTGWIDLLSTTKTKERLCSVRAV